MTKQTRFHPMRHYSSEKGSYLQEHLNPNAVNPFENILQDPSYASTYSAIHGDLLNGGSNRDSTDGAVNKRSSRHRDESFSPDLRRSDVVSVQYLSTANPSKAKGRSSDHSKSSPVDVRGRSKTSSPVSGLLDDLALYDMTESSDRFGQFKRFQTVKRAERPAPYHLDPSGPVKTRSHSSSRMEAEGAPRPMVLRDSVLNSDTALESYSQPKSSSSKYSDRVNRSERRDDSRSSQSSLYSTLMELADDDSFQAHYDSIQTPTGCRPDHHRSESPGRHFSHKHTSSNNVRRALQAHEGAASYSPQTSPRPTGRRGSPAGDISRHIGQSEKERVSGVEKAILDNLAGQVGPLRHTLHKRDLSHSGVVNFDEFRAAMMQHGVEASKSDLREVFRAASDDRRGRGTANTFETGCNDIRYSQGTALDIEGFTARLVERSVKAEQEKGFVQNDCYAAEERRAMRKVLHAANKQADPMRIFCHMANGAGNNEGKGPITSRLAPQQLKEGLETLGSNLTDKEFGYLLHKVGTSHDGKISLLEFDQILHAEVGGYESDSTAKRRNLLKANKRYSKTFQSCDAMNSQCEGEFDKVTDSGLGRADSKKWSKLQGVIQENCRNLPEAFNNAAPYFEMRGRSTDSGIKSHRRSRSLGSAKSWFNNPQGNDFETAGMTTSGRHYGREREDRERERSLRNAEPFYLPVSKLRDVLSDAGVQMGTDDAERLSSFVTREVAPPSSSFRSRGQGLGQVQGQGQEGIEPVVSLEKFCDILGIHRTVNPTTLQTELTDPRSIVSDGGVFSRSIVAPNFPPRQPPDGPPDFSIPRGMQQMQQLQSLIADNRLRNFSSTFLSDSNPKADTPTSLDGSRRRSAAQPSYPHTTDPSRFWEMHQTGNAKDIMASPLPSFRESFPSSPKFSRMGGPSSVTFLGSPNFKGSSKGDQSPRFTSTSPVRGQSPSLTSERDGGRGRGRESFSTPDFTRRRSSSAPPRSSGMGSEGGFERGDGPGGLNLRWASKPLADFIGTKNQSQNLSQNLSHMHGTSTSKDGALRITVDDRSWAGSAQGQSQGQGGLRGSSPKTASTTGDHTTPGSSRPSTPGGVFFSDQTQSQSLATTQPHTQPRGFSLRKSFPDRQAGHGTGSPVTGGGRDARSVSSGAPYAVTFPDQ